jgi:hypothetical protein
MKTAYKFLYLEFFDKSLDKWDVINQARTNNVITTKDVDCINHQGLDPSINVRVYTGTERRGNNAGWRLGKTERGEHSFAALL